MRLPFARKSPPYDPLRPGEPRPGSIPPELLDRIRAIEIKARRLVNDLFLGEYHAVFRGRGIEFDELRPYLPGDDIRSIDWKALARTGTPMIRRYREDRDLTVMFVVDVSASQRAGSHPQTKADLAAEICAVLALAAIRNKDRVGLLLFASKPERFVRPSGGATSETGRPAEVDTSSKEVREAYAAHVAALDRERRLAFGTVGIDEIAVVVGTDYVPALLRFFRRRTVGAA
ncbi:MAG: DUF58 domain-containing protein [Dehalococcoidia bacterium]|nr:DUF58 domain-containing protein [Dehalococcoidia bacterium]